MIYELSYWLHVVSSVAWLGAFLASLFFAFKVGRSYGTGEEAGYMQMERKATSIGAHFGAVGILVSGWVMSVIPGGPQWGWFNIPLYNWLAIKQLIFIIVLVLVGFSIKKSIALKKRWPSEHQKQVDDEARKKWKGAYSLSLAIYFMVVLNTWLGLTKPI